MRTFRCFLPALCAAICLAVSVCLHADEVTLQPNAKPLKFSNRLALTHYQSLAMHHASDRDTTFSGTLELGMQANPTTVTIVVLETPDKPPVMQWTALQGDGIAAPTLVALEPFAYVLNNGEKRTEYRGTAQVNVKYGDTTVAVPLALDWLDPNDVRRRDGKNPLFYYLPPSLGGMMKLGSETYDVLLADTKSSGDFHVKPDALASSILLCIDINHNGTIDKQGEVYDIARPFNIKGVTYQIKNVEISGTKLTVEKSAASVPEVPLPPDLRPGQHALPFKALPFNGKQVDFPTGYKGQLVLLIFWASWCGDCREELPHLLAAYDTFHAKGVAFVGVSVDQPESKDKLTAFMRENKIYWPQIYDGKYWNAAIAKQYALDWIPTLYLVDGTTGKILADNDTLIGKQIDGTLRKFLKMR